MEAHLSLTQLHSTALGKMTSFWLGVEARGMQQTCNTGRGRFRSKLDFVSQTCTQTCSLVAYLGFQRVNYSSVKFIRSLRGLGPYLFSGRQRCCTRSRLSTPLNPETTQLGRL